jgi:hypothetical protein
MKCAICDAEDETVTAYNTDCRVCQAVIYDTIAGYDNDIEEEVEFVDVDIEAIPA